MGIPATLGHHHLSSARVERTPSGEEDGAQRNRGSGQPRGPSRCQVSPGDDCVHGRGGRFLAEERKREEGEEGRASEKCVFSLH